VKVKFSANVSLFRKIAKGTGVYLLVAKKKIFITDLVGGIQ